MSRGRMGIDLCPRCGGPGKQQTFNKLKESIQRSRSCETCGTTWSTAEVSMRFYKVAIAIDRFIDKTLKRKTKT